MKYLKKFNESKTIQLDEEDVKNIFLDLIDATSDVWDFKIEKGRYDGEYFEIKFKIENHNSYNPPYAFHVDLLDEYPIINRMREDFIKHDYNEIIEEIRDRIHGDGFVLAGPNRTPGYGISFKILDKNHYDGSTYYG